MKDNKNFETYTQELLDLVSCLTRHTAYKDFQHVSDKIKDAIQNGNTLTIHSQYPFLTDMFFHIIIAELKSQSEWLDWLWENDIKPILGKEKFLAERDNWTFDYSSLLEMIDSYAQANNGQNHSTPIASKIEEYFNRNLDDMKKYLESASADFDNVKEHIILAKFQLKFIACDKRKKCLMQYIAILKGLRELQSVQVSDKLVRIIDFFIEKYENIPMNFCNDDEFGVLGSFCGDALSDKVFFNKLLSGLEEIHKKHNEQTNELDKKFSELDRCDNAELKNVCHRWDAVSNAKVYGKIKTPDEAFPSYIKQGIEAQILLHKMCANRYYHIDHFGGGKIPAKHLDGKFDRTGQLIKVDYISDGIAIDVFTHIIDCRMREYLDGEHSDSYLTSIIDNVCADKIDNLTGANRTYKASGENISTHTPVGNSQDGDKTKTLEDLIPAPELVSTEDDYQNLVLENIKKHSPELYLFLLLLYHGVTVETLSALRNNGFAIQAQSLTIGQDLKKQEILEIIGKGGNAHYFKRSLEKLLQKPEFREMPELREISQEIVRFLNRK